MLILTFPHSEKRQATFGRHLIFLQVILSQQSNSIFFPILFVTYLQRKSNTYLSKEIRNFFFFFIFICCARLCPFTLSRCNLYTVEMLLLKTNWIELNFLFTRY